MKFNQFKKKVNNNNQSYAYKKEQQEKKINNPLKFTCQQDGTIKITKNGSPTVDGLQYKLMNNDWQTYTIDTVISLKKRLVYPI